MKRTAGIILFFLLFFNTAGLYLVFMSLRYKANRQLEARLDAGLYNQQQTITVKIPISLPYLANSKDYERVDGELFYHGQHYNAVKHRIFRDTMYTIYIRDAYKNNLYQEINKVVRLFTDVPLSHSENSHIWDNLLKEYLPVNFTAMLQTSGFAVNIILPDVQAHLSFMAHAVLSPPPKA